MVIDPMDLMCNHHLTPTRGGMETVNRNLNGAFLSTTSPQCVGAIRFEAGALRGVNLQVGFDPQPSNPYHGEVWGNFTGAMKSRILPSLASWFMEIEGVAISARS